MQIYNVQLIISNDCGVDSINLAVFVEIVEANFSIDDDRGCLPHTVNFQNNSLGTIDDFLWTFEGGNPATSTDENPQVVYNTAGLFDVQLEIYGAQGSDTILMNEAIEVSEVPVANFDFFFSAQGTANFNNNSIFANTYEWDFGDGGPVSTEEMPFHIYNDVGNFIVTLTASNEFCSNTFIDTVSILTSVDELDYSKVRIFPNPSSDFVTIELQNSDLAEFEVFSIEGKRMDTFNGEFIQSKKLDVSAIPDGVYMISILQNGKRGMFRWVKIE